MLQLILAAVVLLGADTDASTRTGPFLSADVRAVEAGTDSSVTSLEPGGAIDLTVTVRADRRQGVKINQQFESHFLRLQVLEMDDEGERKRTLSSKEFSVEPKSPRIDPATGIGKLTVRLPESTHPRSLRLRLIAEVMLCDTGNTWCFQIREASLITLPGGTVEMKTLPLQYHAGDSERVVLKTGDEAPDFIATNSEGQPVRLSGFRGRKNIVLVFGRGFW